MDTLRLALIIIGVLILVAIYVFTQRRHAARGMGQTPVAERDETLPADTTGLESEDLSRQLTQLSDMISSGDERVPRLSDAVTQDAARAPEKDMHAQITQAKAWVQASSKAAQRDEPRPAPAKTRQAAASGVTSAPRRDTDKYAAAAQIFVLNVVAPEGYSFAGPALLQALNASGMVWGDMQIFHRYAEQGPAQRAVFSLANMLKPGSFEPDKMESFTTTGVTLFMQLPTPIDPLSAYEAMLDAAQSIAVYLGGELRDAQRVVLTIQAVEHTKEQLREYQYQAGAQRR